MHLWRKVSSLQFICQKESMEQQAEAKNIIWAPPWCWNLVLLCKQLHNKHGQQRVTNDQRQWQGNCNHYIETSFVDKYLVSTDNAYWGHFNFIVFPKHLWVLIWNQFSCGGGGDGGSWRNSGRPFLILDSRERKLQPARIKVGKVVKGLLIDLFGRTSPFKESGLHLSLCL